jgi:hypothetical protein
MLLYFLNLSYCNVQNSLKERLEPRGGSGKNVKGHCQQTKECVEEGQERHLKTTYLRKGQGLD